MTGKIYSDGSVDTLLENSIKQTVKDLVKVWDQAA
jgi:hypothetical protein